jgi:tRNA G18 (ribose-2'-O)-methylase SpoU
MGSVLYPQLLQIHRFGSYEDIKHIIEDFTRISACPRGEKQSSLFDPVGKRIALLMGNESHGVPAEILSNFESVSIPQRGFPFGPDSLNLAAASAILMHQYMVN